MPSSPQPIKACLQNGVSGQDGLSSWRPWGRLGQVGPLSQPEVAHSHFVSGHGAREKGQGRCSTVKVVQGLRGQPACSAGSICPTMQPWRCW